MNKEIADILDKTAPHILAVSVINLDNVAKNYAQIKAGLTEKTQVAGVIKANSYGFGAVPVAKRLYKEGCRMFFVATIEEGIEARNVLANDAQIFVLSGLLAGTEDTLTNYELTPVLNNPYQADLWIAHETKVGKKLDTVVHVDTGMFRNGFSQEDAELYSKKITQNLNLNFVMSHLACADILGHPMNKIQLEKFRTALKTFGNPKGSLSATNGMFLGSEYDFDVVRPGKSLYGFSIRKDKIGSFLPVMDVYARIVQINKLKAGDTIGYGATFVAEHDMTTVTIGIGYADGFMRKFAGYGHGFLGGKRIPIVGRISMDYMTLDASEVDTQYLKMGDWVALTQSPDYTLEKWALELNTLPHEVACRFGPRVKKVYIGEV
ncbi:MAG: alanine racemase [Alphaproteobacteria bacterium]|nr:alanine racemase [Alphaproteobacteria bacterium]